MKKMYFLLATLLTLNYAFAQDNTPTDKGVVFLKGGSNLAIDFFKIKDDLGQEKNSTEFTLNVGGGYFVSKNFALGAGIDLESFDNVSYTNYNLFMRYYPLGKVILEAGLLSLDSANDSGEDKRLNLVNLEAGYAFFVNDYFSVEPTLRFKNLEGNQFSMHVRLGIYW